MGWAYEHLPSTTHTKVWQRKFLVLKKLQLQIFNVAPVRTYIHGLWIMFSRSLHVYTCMILYMQENAAEWVRPDTSYKLLEMTVKVLKVKCA